MTRVQSIVGAAPVGVDYTDEPDLLSAIAKPGTSAVIWRRQMPGSVRSWLKGLTSAHLPSGQLVLRPNAVAAAVAQLCDICGMPKGRERDWLETDIASLADVFGHVMSTEYVRLRLDVVRTNACRKFHMDAVTARLVCTYRGTGTQYGNSNDRSDPERIFTVQTGAPVLLRGTLWPSRSRAGLLHRSPPIEGTGETRLVLVMDPMSEPFEETERPPLARTAPRVH
ncbi:DUF1826 domain-containing protein [Shimia abyssi]|uniref:Uncharacterized protein DUF1826 n=1 Tax=Shimia abyssi TaxID=1662395 RepID=A0A2P8FG91_9RHOB|nr:DUF1826 domain-containing protein [Shimia abyssi]PSL20733.1 uncharacterized protein DUF1826 [Shimia abyssi]